MTRKYTMTKLRMFFFAAILLTSLTSSAQSRYCKTYEDFLEGRWEQLDTVYYDSHSKEHQAWWGGNDYTLTTGNKATDKILKNDAFAVMQGDSIYLNCRNLRYDKCRFGNGYTKARRIGERSLLFVNRLIGRNQEKDIIVVGAAFGAIGAAITANKQMKNQVCYVISSGADEDGKIAIRPIDDHLMNQMIDNRVDLHDEYYAEKDLKKRRLASHVIPILEKSGLFDQYNNHQD